MSSEGRECSPYPKFSSFLSQVLFALQMLQSEENYRCGVPLKAIAEFMKGYFKLTGDVVSQVKTSVLEGERRGLIVKSYGGGYCTVGAIAKIQLCGDLADRKKLLQDVFEVFINKSNAPVLDTTTPCETNSAQDLFKLLDEYLKTKRRNVKEVRRNKCTVNRNNKKKQCKEIAVSSSSSSSAVKSKSCTKKCRKK